MDLKLQVPETFPAFPFQPYAIQLDLMRRVFASIEDRKVAIMESPTGTVSGCMEDLESDRGVS